jgi:ParB-like chromosome segregation protein Spo0J
MKTETVNISKIKSNPNNPRTIRDEKFKNLVQSIKDFPEMLNIRPIVVNEQMVVLGGNMRLKACIEAGVKEVPVIITKLSEQKQKEFIIKDNVSGGEWDWGMLANEWEEEELKEWGLDLPNDADNFQDEKDTELTNNWYLNVEFTTEKECESWYENLTKQGLICKIIL